LVVQYQYLYLPIVPYCLERLHQIFILFKLANAVFVKATVKLNCIFVIFRSRKMPRHKLLASMESLCINRIAVELGRRSKDFV
jgi:hypothetical protein